MEMASSTGKAGRRGETLADLVSSLLVYNRETKGCLEPKAGLTELQQGETMGRLEFLCLSKISRSIQICIHCKWQSQGVGGRMHET